MYIRQGRIGWGRAGGKIEGGGKMGPGKMRNGMGRLEDWKGNQEEEGTLERAGERIEGEMDRTRESGGWGSSF